MTPIMMTANIPVLLIPVAMITVKSIPVMMNHVLLISVRAGWGGGGGGRFLSLNDFIFPISPQFSPVILSFSFQKLK
jgi:hypothetical protein